MSQIIIVCTLNVHWKFAVIEMQLSMSKLKHLTHSACSLCIETKKSSEIINVNPLKFWIFYNQTSGSCSEAFECKESTGKSLKLNKFIIVAVLAIYNVENDVN